MKLKDLLVRLYVAKREKYSGTVLKYEGVTVERNVRYGERKIQTFSLYRKSERVLPVILYFHDGAVAGRNKNSRRSICVSLASHLDVAVMNVEYKGETSLGVRDCLKETEKILEYLGEHHKSLALNPEKVFLMGDGIGAYVATSLALKNGKYGVNVIGVLGLCGLYDTIVHAKENQYYPTQYHLMKKFFGIDLKHASEREVAKTLDETSVNRVLTEDYPPCFIAHTMLDEFLPTQGDVMVKALKQKRVSVWEYRVVGEKLYHNFFLRKSKASRSIKSYVNEFIEEALRGGIYRNEYREI